MAFLSYYEGSYDRERLHPWTECADSQRCDHGWQRRDNWSESYRRNAGFYDRKSACKAIGTPYVRPDCVGMHNLYANRICTRDGLTASLQEDRVATAIRHPVPMDLSEHFSHLGYEDGYLTKAAKAAWEVLALPVHTQMMDEIKECVIDTVSSRHIY